MGKSDVKSHEQWRRARRHEEEVSWPSPVTSLPFTLVPLLLPRSLICHCPSSKRISACFSDTDGSLIWMGLAFVRPTRKLLLPSEAIDFPFRGPSRISSVNAGGVAAISAMPLVVKD